MGPDRASRQGLLAALFTLAMLGGLAASRAGIAPKVASPHGSFKEECALCHGADAWTPARISRKFDHAKYGFALTGAHAAAACKACHASLDFSQARTLCVSCHEDPHRGEMGTECATCHGARSFIERSTMLRAHQLSHFPLTGGHATLECEACHRGAAQGQLQFVGTQAECKACHMKDYDAATNPSHVAGRFSLECRSCHTASTWQGARFGHGPGSRFPLTGAHATTPCQSCHGDGVYGGKNMACVSCHQSNYDATTSPNHAAAGYNTQCQNCHNTVSWGNGTFDHNTTRFPLTGAHATTPCNSCHGDGVYAGKNMACVSCHQSNYDATTSPNHAGAGFPTSCQTCHNTSSWAGATFDHDSANFPIYSGRHAGRWSDCTTCHSNPANYAVFTCFSCHPHDDQASTTSRHSRVSGFRYDSQACYSCHPRGNT